jgi:HSP20 family protein
MRYLQKTLSDPGNVFNALERFESEMGRMLDSFAVSDSSGLFDRAITPAIDVMETQDELLVVADIPGVEKKDIELSLTGNVLSLKGEKREEKDPAAGKLFRKETWSGSFRRTLALPDSVDAEKVSAELKDGVLTIRIRKKEALKPKLIAVDAK